MSSPSTGHRVYRFGTFDVDPDAAEVRKRGVRIRVQEQPLRLLVALLERPGELITREELHGRLWPDDTFVDFEHGLNAAATRLRQALGDSAQTPRFIESVPRRGYRFIASVEPAVAGVQPPAPPCPPESPTTTNSAPMQNSNWPKIDWPPGNKSWMQILPWSAACFFLLSTAVLSRLYVRERNHDDRLITYNLSLPDGLRLAPFDTTAISPNGRLLVYTATNLSGESHLWIRPLDATADRRLDRTDGATFPFWSPDSGAIGFFANGRLNTIEASGVNLRTICDAPSGRGGSWNRNGLIVFAPNTNSGLFQVPAKGGDARSLTDLNPSLRELSHRWPSFLPDGDHFLYMVHSAPPAMSGTYVGSVAPGPSKLLLRDATNTAYADSGQGDGYLVFARHKTLMGQPFDTGRLALTGEPFRVAERLVAPWAIEPLRASFSVSDTRLLTYETVRGTDRLTWLDRNGVTLDTMGESGEHLVPALSPDEKEVAVDQFDPHTGTYNIWRIDRERGGPSRFTFDSGNHNSPVWSPDGRRITFARNPGFFDLYVKSISGEGGEQLLLKSARFKIPTDWSPDGSYLAYWEIEPQSGNRALWVLPMAGGGKPWRLLNTDSDDRDAAFSPDGKWFAYSSDQSGKREIYVQPFPPSAGSGKWMVSNGGGSRPTWPRAGKELFYVAPDNKIMAVEVSHDRMFQAGVPHALFQSNMVEDFRVRFAVTADGRRFLIPTAAGTAASPSTTVVVNWLTSVKQ
jgi:Tol biopolymer transport system component/DNA-binding winged helix-turn-helix (wHTH) protein